MYDLEYFLAESVSRHKSLCPRQVLGVRIGLAGADALGIDVPREDKKLLVIVETDGCFVSGVEVVTGCAVRHRTLRVEDYGKVAATFVDVASGDAVRVAPRLDIRQRAKEYAHEEKRRYFAMLNGYQRMPTESLLSIEKVSLSEPVESIVSRAGIRVNCDHCGEEIINERDTIKDGFTLCQSCLGSAYYNPSNPEKISYNLLLSNIVLDNTA